ncbi:MAG: uroporphyrinogen-III C-methyltransferase [Acutalibacteraceae bacterium]
MNKNKVILVGAGCKDGLITVRGLEELKKADAVVYDNLVPPSLLSECKKDCKLIYVGKRKGIHSKTQDEINRILIDCGKKVPLTVRLKGGDSFVFSRGGEELLALEKEGIACETVPGVTSAVAIPELFGLPVTHRGLSQSFTVVTASSADEKEENYKALAALDGTLVFLMGLSFLSDICRKLTENGKAKDTPVSVLCGGFERQHERFDGTLATIGKKAENAFSPAVIVVGKTASLDLREREKKPLSGVSVAVTGTDSFTRKLTKKLSEKGADVNRYAYLTVKSQSENIPERFDGFSCLAFTSANGVEIFFDELKKRKTDYRSLFGLRFAVIGEGTAEKLMSYGFRADFMPDVYSADELGKLLSKKLRADEKVLILRAQDGSTELTKRLDEGKIDYTDCPIYKTEINKDVLSLIKGNETYTVFASAKSVTAFFENGCSLGNSKAVCIGEKTAARFGEYCTLPCLTAKAYTVEGIIEIIENDRKESDRK